MKKYNLKKQDEIKELKNWINRFQHFNKGSVSIVNNKILSPSWNSQHDTENADLINYLKTYKIPVILFFYEEIDDVKFDITLKIDVLRDAVNRLINSYPNNYDGKILGGKESFSFLLFIIDRDTQKLFALPPVGLMEYGQYTYWDDEIKGNCWDVANYLWYYFKNIQKFQDCYIDGNDKPPVRMYEGLSVNDFMKKFNEKTFVEKQMELMKWMGHQYDPVSLKEEQCDLVLLQRRLESGGEQVSFGNILLLADFIKEKSESRYFALLEPTIEELLKAIEKRGGISRIVFECDNKENVICDSTSQINFLKQALKNKIDSDKRKFKLKKIVKWSELTDKTIIQALFVQDMVLFLTDYFPNAGGRKKGSPVSTAEQELIMWAMYRVGLSKKKGSDSRFRQLMSIYKKSNIDHNPDYSIPPKDIQKKTGIRIIALDFLSWQQWHENNIDWSQPFKKLTLQEGDELQIL